MPRALEEDGSALACALAPRFEVGDKVQPTLTEEGDKKIPPEEDTGCLKLSSAEEKRKIQLSTASLD